jgi:hypothetical protein
MNEGVLNLLVKKFRAGGVRLSRKKLKSKKYPV